MKKNMNTTRTLDDFEGRVTLACCGLFHYGHSARALNSRLKYTHLIYSHKLPSARYANRQTNIFWKEYLIRFLMKGLSDRNAAYFFPLVHELWDIAAAASFDRCDVLSVMLHGNCRRLILKAKKTGTVVVGEAVNSHPINYNRVLADQAAVCSVKHDKKMPLQLRRLAAEIPLCDHIMVPSEYVRDSFIRYGVHYEKMSVNPFGADLSVVKNGLTNHSDKRYKDGFKCVCVAQVIPRKGIHWLIQAWIAGGFAANKNCSLRIVGRISTEMIYLAQTAPANVVFIGPANRPTVIKELQEAAVFVLPTMEEGFALSILEAMAAGCAIVTTTASGASVALTDGVNAFITQPADVTSLVTALSNLYASPDLRMKFGRLSTIAVKGGFTWEDYANRALSVYKATVDARK